MSEPTVINQISNGGDLKVTATVGPSVRDKTSTTLQPVDATPSGTGRNIRGPRCITIQRSSFGFGFTLRHFIVYPPDSVSDCPEEWQRGMSAGLLDPLIPMDTIFVKHVRENGPATKAGLSTGDQVVSVNGESVICKSYAQVVQMIQKSGPNLQLMVMPKEHDVLQQCFAGTAHNPQTNARPIVAGSYPAPSAPDQSAKMNLDALKTNFFSHLPRPKPYQPFQADQRKLPTVASTNVHSTTSATAASARPSLSSSAAISRVLPSVNDEMMLTASTAPASATTSTSTTSTAQARLVAAALVSQSVRKSADFNSSGDYTNTSVTDAYPDVSRNRGSLADYSASANASGGAHSTAANKRSSFAGTPTSRSEFILSINPPLTFTMMAGPSAPNNAVMGRGGCEPMVLESNHGSLASLAAHRDSLTSSKGSLYSDDRSPSDQVMTRIKKSFEQKEEFLKRPTLPYWVNSDVQSPPIPKEFYAQPQKFSRPLWPPSSSIDSQESLNLDPPKETTSKEIASKDASSKETAPKEIASKETTKTNQVPIRVSVSMPVRAEVTTVPTSTSIESWSMVFTSTKPSPPNTPPSSPGTSYGAPLLGIVPNTVPKPFYGSSNTSPSSSSGRIFVSTLTRIQENIPCDPSGNDRQRSDLNLKLKQTLHAPLASPEEFTPSPTKSGTSTPHHNHHHPLTSRSSGGGSDVLMTSIPESIHPTIPLGEKGLLSRVAQRKQEESNFQPTPAPRSEKRRLEGTKMPGTGNRTVIIGGNKLHCDPPAPPPEYGPSYERDVLWNAKNESEIRKTVLRQHSYRSAVRAFSASKASVSGDADGSHPAQHDPHEAADRDEPVTLIESATVSHSMPASVNRRQKIYDDDSDRAMRRVSYLKATAGERLPIDSDGDINEHETESVPTVTTPTIPEHAKGRPAESRPHPHSIQKLRALFGDSSKVNSGGAAAGAANTGTKPIGPGSIQHPHCTTVSLADASKENVLASPNEHWREGWLNVKQTIADYKRSADRSWRQVWAKLRQGQLLFYRDRKDSTEEMIIDLRSGTTIEVALYYTKRKHVLRLCTANGLCEHLLQCEDNNDMVLWLQHFNEQSSDKEDVQPSAGGYSSSEMILVRQAHEIENSHGSNQRRMGRFTLHRNRSPTGHSPVSKTRKPSLPGEPPSSPNKPTTWRRKVVKQFKRIQGNSPNSPSHPQIPEGATIGVPLEFCPRSSLSENIPLIVELCIGIVEARGLESVGVYRVPGNSVAVNALTDSLNKGFDCLNQQDPRWNDVNVISSLIKSFFRKLPDPLITAELYSSLIEASKMEPDAVRLNAIKRLTDELPEPHYSTLRFLICHLTKVAKKSSINKMEARNLAIVFGPTLIRPGDDNTVTMVTDMSHQCRIVETLIDKADHFFPEDVLDAQPPNSPTQPSAPVANSIDDRKGIYAKEIVSSIISAARRKRQSSLDSPDMSDRKENDPAEPHPTDKPAGSELEVIVTTNIIGGSAHSLIELGSTGDAPALPVEASAFRMQDEAIPERKRSASLGGESILPPCISNHMASELGSITEFVDGNQSPAEACEFRSRTSSGSFVSSKSTQAQPIDAAGIRSYCGLSAVTQERIRRFEQETKALLQRDLARQWRDTDVRRLDKSEVESAWQRAKLEMETDDFLDALADNPSDMADKIAIIIEARQTALQPLTVLPSDSFVRSVTDVSKSDLPAPEQDQPAAAVLPALPPVESQTMQIPSQIETETVDGSSQQELKDKLEVEAEAGAACDIVTEASGAQELPITIQTAAASSTSRKSSSTSKLNRVSTTRSHIPKLTPLKTSRESSPTKASTVAAATTTQPSMKPSSRPAAVTSRSRTTGEMPKSSRKIGESPVKIVRQLSASTISSSSSSSTTTTTTNSSSAAKTSTQTKATPATPKANPRSFKTTENPSKRSTASVRNLNESKKTAVTDSELLPKGRPSLSKTMRGYSLDDPCAPPSSEFCPPIASQEKVFSNTSQLRSQVEGSEAEAEERTNSSATKRSVELKSLDIKIKRSDSLTKDEKTECNTKAREREQRGAHNGRPKRFFQRGESGLKRRHTVGGTRDFDKVRIRWLTNNNHGCEEESIPAPRWSAWDRLQPLISDEDLNVDRSLKTWMRSERMRTSSPELCRRSETCATFPPLFALGLESELVAGTPMNI